MYTCIFILHIVRGTEEKEEEIKVFLGFHHPAGNRENNESYNWVHELRILNYKQRTK